MKGKGTRDNSKGFKSMTPGWGSGRSHAAQPPRAQRNAKPSSAKGSGDSRPPATHAKYGVDPGVGPNRAPRTVGKGAGGSGDARPPCTRKGYAVDGVPLKTSGTYGV